MEPVFDFLSNLLNTKGWPPRWLCGTWTKFHGWLYILSDIAIWAAYFVIPIILVAFIIKKANVPFHGVFLLFGIFILACGLTHLMDAVMFWWPAYRLSALVRFFTAIASWGTIFALYKIMPLALLLKTPAELEKVVEERTSELNKKHRDLEESNEKLKHSYEDTEIKVTFRNLELEKEVLKLREENQRLKGLL